MEETRGHRRQQGARRRQGGDRCSAPRASYARPRSPAADSSASIHVPGGGHLAEDGAVDLLPGRRGGADELRGAAARQGASGGQCGSRTGRELAAEGSAPPRHGHTRGSFAPWLVRRRSPRVSSRPRRRARGKVRAAARCKVRAAARGEVDGGE